MATNCKVEYIAPNGFKVVQILESQKVLETIQHLEEQGYCDFYVNNQRLDEYVTTNIGS